MFLATLAILVGLILLLGGGGSRCPSGSTLEETSLENVCVTPSGVVVKTLWQY